MVVRIKCGRPSPRHRSAGRRRRTLDNLLSSRDAETRLGLILPKLGVKPSLNLAAKQGVDFRRLLLPFDRDFAESPGAVTPFCSLQCEL